MLATQNPIESEGTYPLPEAQIDRFMLKILIGYPEHDEELTIVQRQLTAHPELREVLSLDELRQLQTEVGRIYVDPALVSYAVALAAATRNPVEAGVGRSRRVRRVRRLAARADRAHAVGAARSPCCADATTRPPRTCARSPRTRSGIGSSSATRHWPRT